MMIPAASAITDRARSEGIRAIARLAENLDPEVAAFLGRCLALDEADRAASRKVAAVVRDERIRWLRNQLWPQYSGRRVAAEILRVAASLRIGEPQRSEPKTSVAKIIEFNGGLIPSERTIRAALRD
ncbi:hypothetical protein WKI41_13805 [Agrobacterium larrymoorei]